MHPSCNPHLTLADADQSGELGMEEVAALEEQFGIPLSVSAASADWRDGKIAFAEFLGWVIEAGHKVAKA